MAILIQNATLIDGTGKAPVAGAAVLVEGNAVVAAGPRNEVLDRLEGRALTIDAEGGTVLPGMINCHDHVWRKTLRYPKAGGTYRESAWQLRGLPPMQLMLLSASNVLKELKAGVTTLRDMGSPEGIALNLRDAINQGWLEGPRILASGLAVTITGGHGWQYARQADGPDEVRKAVREQLRARVDHLKFKASGGLTDMPIESPQTVEFTVEEMTAGVEEAHKRHRLTCVHADATLAIRNSILSGIDTIEHGAFLDDECIAMMKERGTTLTPTLSGLHRVAVYYYEAGDKSMGDLITREALEPHEESFGKAVKAGIFYAAGTDSAGEMIEEMQLMMRCSVSPLEAIVSATGNAAKQCRIDDRLGTLEPGKLADLFVCAGDPLDDITALRAVRCVIKDGHIVEGTLKLKTEE